MATTIMKAHIIMAKSGSLMETKYCGNYGNQQSWKPSYYGKPISYDNPNNMVINCSGNQMLWKTNTYGQLPKFQREHCRICKRD